MIVAWLSAFLLLIGAGALYLASPNQILLASPLAGRGIKLLGIGGLIASLALLLTVMGSATAVFTWTTGLMLLWSVAPVVIRWLRFRKEQVG